MSAELLVEFAERGKNKSRPLVESWGSRTSIHLWSALFSICVDLPTTDAIRLFEEFGMALRKNNRISKKRLKEMLEKVIAEEG